MKFTTSLKNNLQFQNVYKNGKSKANRLLIMYVVENHQDMNRLGISVSKKVGNSVVRHHITRLIREAYRLHQDEVKKGYDIVIVARVASKNCNYFDVESSYLHLVKLHHLNQQN